MLIGLTAIVLCGIPCTVEPIRFPVEQVLIFPTTAVCNSFYRELTMEHFPNRYAAYLAALRADSRLDKLSHDKHGVPKGARKMLELGGILRKGVVDDAYVADAELPSAPLRAFSYTQAGGGASTGHFLNAVFKCPDGYAGSYPNKLRRNGGYSDFCNSNHNPFSNKIILMDEVHNLVKPSEEIMRNPRRLEMIRKLRKMLLTAENSVVIGFTGTPLCETPAYFASLMKIIKGSARKDATDEGFLSFYMDTPRAVYVLARRSDPHATASAAEPAAGPAIMPARVALTVRGSTLALSRRR